MSLIDFNKLAQEYDLDQDDFGFSAVSEEEYNSTTRICFDDSTIADLDLFNDFGQTKNSINIIAKKIEPKIIKFYSSKIVRDSIDPIILQWETLNATKIQIINVKSDFSENGKVVAVVSVQPVASTNPEIALLVLQEDQSGVL